MEERYKIIFTSGISIIFTEQLYSSLLKTANHFVKKRIKTVPKKEDDNHKEKILETPKKVWIKTTQ